MFSLNGLDVSQKKAVEKTEGPLVVLAGAGSGKTRVLTHRILHLIEKGTPPEKILAVTFTNKAAKEMRERVRSLLDEHSLGTSLDEPLPLITTFHGLGVRILKEEGRVLQIPRFFSIWDRNDSLKAIKDALISLGVDPKEIDPRRILNRISKEKGAGRGFESRPRDSAKHFMERIFSDTWRIYEETLQKTKALDFDDLIMKPLTLLREHKDVRERLQNTWKYIHIDEYQDTNRAQSELVDFLGAKHRNIFVVGDLDQSIYTWRGATIENILSFEERYPEAETLLLEQNYRSTKTIVEAANSVIEKNKNRKEKTSFTEKGLGAPISLTISDTESEEAMQVALRAKKEIERGIPSESIAVLYRTNFQSRALEDAFLGAGVPYQVLGVRFYERKEVKDVLSYLRLAKNESATPDLVRIINTPARGIGKTTLLHVLNNTNEALSPAARQKVEKFFTLMEDIRKVVNEKPASEAVRYTIEKSGIKEALDDGTEDGKERFENVQELVSLAANYDALPHGEGIEKLLEEASLMSDQDELSEVKKGVKLMTVHAAKGLEFTSVFITGLEEGLFPHGRDDAEDEEEERRLFYVAITRAHERLFLSLAQTRRLYGTLQITEPSSFLSDIGSSLIVFGDTHHDEEIIEA